MHDLVARKHSVKLVHLLMHDRVARKHSVKLVHLLMYDLVARKHSTMKIPPTRMKFVRESSVFWDVH